MKTIHIEEFQAPSMDVMVELHQHLQKNREKNEVGIMKKLLIFLTEILPKNNFCESFFHESKSMQINFLWQSFNIRHFLQEYYYIV